MAGYAMRDVRVVGLDGSVRMDQWPNAEVLRRWRGYAHCKFIRNNPFTNKHHIQTEDVLCNPQNPVNPDSEPSVRSKY